VHFIRNVAMKVVRVESGVVTEYPGDWEYYCWKRGAAALHPAAADAPSAGRTATPSGAATTDIERTARGERLDRRRAAEARQALARRTRGLRDEIQTLEQAIEELEREKAGLAGDLADPETYKRPGPEVADLQRRYAEVEKTLAERTDRWMEVQERLEEELAADAD
jgi:ATP-binding cassette subfamily F protein 3